MGGAGGRYLKLGVLNAHAGSSYSVRSTRMLSLGGLEAFPQENLTLGNRI